MRFTMTVLALLLLTTSGAAQRPITISIAGGLSAPHSDLRDAADLGWHALAALNISSIMLPLGIRLEAAYNRFPFGDSVQPSLGDGSQNVLSLTGNFTYRLPMTRSPISPYLIGGMGAYRSSCAGGSSCGSATEFGWNVGLGAKLYALGLRPFIEARFHNTERGIANVHYFPLTVGLTF